MLASDPVTPFDIHIEARPCPEDNRLSAVERLAIAMGVAPILRARIARNKQRLIKTFSGKTARLCDLQNTLLVRYAIEISVGNGEREKEKWCENCGMLFENPKRGTPATRCKKCQRAKRSERATERNVKRNAARKAAGKCAHCAEPAEQGETICAECNRKRAERCAKRNAARKAAGKCAHCAEPAEQGKTLCAECARKNAERGAQRKAARATSL